MNETIRTCALPIERTHSPKAGRAILALHGYTGYPGELALPLQLLYEQGFDVFAPRYPGHGTSGEDFLRTDYLDWVREAEEAYRRLESEYDQVYLIGHSMGGLIAAHLASQFDIERMVLFAPAFLLTQNIPVPLLTLISLFRKRSKTEWAQDTEYPLYGDRDEGDDLYLGSEYWSYRYYRQIASLEKLRRLVLQELPEILTDTLVFTGGLDTVVKKETGPLVEEGMKGENNRWIHLENGTHLIPYDKDDVSRERAMQETILFLSV